MGVLTKTVPRYVVDEVLAETGKKEKRSRLLPAHVVVYFVMALALFRDGYDEVLRTLVHGVTVRPHLVEGVAGTDPGGDHPGADASG